MAYFTTQYPFNTVVYITDMIGGEAFQASGVLVSADEVLTASHVVWSEGLGAAAPSSISVTPAYSQGYAPYGSATVGNYHYFKVNDTNDELTADQSAQDFALLHLDHSFAVGSMGISAKFGGGYVSITGYPAAANGVQVDSTVYTQTDPNYAVPKFSPINSGVSPGSSGGPLWTNDGGNPAVVGVVSTSGVAALITGSDLSLIQSWIAADHGLSGGGGGGATAGQPLADRFGADFHKSGVSDILFENASSGLLLDWKISNGGYAGNTPIAGAASGWAYRGIGDFNGDGTSDILFQNANSGLMLYWQISQGGYQSAVPLAGATADWRYVATGDFHGDSSSDILFRNLNSGLLLDWQLSGGRYASANPIAGASSDWTTLGTGDFNGDGTSDILFKNSNSGQLLFWQIGNGGYQKAVSIAGASSDWKYLAIGDFNGDGTSDILFQNANTGLLLDWEIKNGALAASVPIAAASSGWQFAGTGDFTGGGTSDILFHNTDSGLLLYWQISDGAFEKSVPIAGAAAGWSVLG